MEGQEAREIFGDSPDVKVIEFARKAMEEGVRHLVCAPKEARLLRQHAEFDGLKLICPNIRSEWAMKAGEVVDDQDPDRALTPAEAAEAGIDYFVIGRPIRNATQYGLSSRSEACKQINAEAGARSDR